MRCDLIGEGAVGTWGAMESGKSDGGFVENTAPQVNDLLDAQETWANRAMTISIIAGLGAVGSELAAGWPRTARAVAIVAALVSMTAAYGIYETGHRGGAAACSIAAGRLQSRKKAPLDYEGQAK